MEKEEARGKNRGPLCLENRKIIILLMAFEIRFPKSTKGVLYFVV